MEKDIMIGRKLHKVLPNSEAFYTEYWRSGKVVKNCLLSYFWDETPEALEFGQTE